MLMIEGLRIVVSNAAELADKQKTSPESFAMIRRQGFGASDASVLLSVNPYKSVMELVKEKASTEMTEEELRIGLLPNVRKGTDLEPIILKKFEEWYGSEVNKPSPMYEIERYPFLRVNFDGLTEDNIPVECKFVSAKAEKYWIFENEVTDPTWRPVDNQMPPRLWSQQHCTQQAAKCGIPVYYYTQCQQQMLASGAGHAYLAAIFDKAWDFHVFYVPRDELTINALIAKGHEAWAKVKALKEKRA